MRVFNIMLAPGRGGIETMAVRYHQALEAEGFEVLSIGHPNGSLAEHAASQQFWAVNARFDRDPIAMFRLAALMRSQQPDLVLTHGGRATALALAVAGGRRVVQVMHNQFFKRYSRNLRAAVCVSRSVHDAARATYPTLPLVEVPNFIDLQPLPVKQAPRGLPVIGSLGRLHEQKGFDIFLDALALLKADGRAFAVRIAGDGPERGALAEQCKRLALENEVSFTGWVSPVGGFLGGLDLFVMASHYEPFGLALIEAMAAGTPAIAPDIEGPAEILERGRYGRLFTNRDRQGLRTAMAQALDDWPRALEMAERAQGHAISHYGLTAGRARLAAAIRAIAAL